MTTAPHPHGLQRPRRYVIVGNSGSGKSTFAQSLAQQLSCRYVEMDSLFWGPDWAKVDPQAFIARVDVATRSEEWVADGNYTAPRPLLWGRATHIIWLNYSLPVTMFRVLKRTLQRLLTRQVLWHGNRESWRKSFLSKDSILLWAFNSYQPNRKKYALLQADPDYAHLTWTVLTRPSEAEAFLREVAAGLDVAQ